MRKARQSELQKMLGVLERAARQKNPILPDDLLAAIFTLMPVRKFSRDPQRIHETIALLRAESDFHDLLPFGFSDGPIHVFSRSLERCLDRLQLAKIINVADADFETYEVSEEALPYCSKILLRLENSKPGIGARLEKLAERFAELCRT